MSEVELKQEIKNLVEASSDVSILNSIKSLLEQEKLKEVMSARIEKAEADVKNGRLYTMDEVEQKLSKY